MLAWLKKNRARRQRARFLYGSIVTAARHPIFYACWGAPDTVQGRFELIVLHMVLLQQRLLREGDDGGRLARALSEAFVTDMDDQMREMTFGDLRVPREIRGAAVALFDRWRSYGAALSGRDEGALKEALAASFGYLDPGGRLATAPLAAYMCRAAAVLAAEPAEQLLAGDVVWPSLPQPSSHREQRP
jgi:cytochrome b pre-mRNA-processing protein 3